MCLDAIMTWSSFSFEKKNMITTFQTDISFLTKILGLIVPGCNTLSLMNKIIFTFVFLVSDFVLLFLSFFYCF